MVIAGQEIDIDAIAGKAIADCRKAYDGHYDHVDREEQLASIRNILENEILVGIYHALAYGKKRGFLDMREAVSYMISHGLPKEDVRFRINGYRLRLKNRKYHLLRSYDHEGFALSLYREDGKDVVGYKDMWFITAEQFAGLLFAFDEFIPSFRERCDAFLEELKAKWLENEKEERIKGMKDKTVEMICRKHLSPDNILFNVFIPSGDRDVTVFLEKVQRAEITLPIEKMCRFLQNKDAVMASLTDVPPEKLEEERATHSSFTI